MRNETRNLFISHAPGDESAFKALQDFFKKQGFDSVDGSLPGSRPGALQDEVLTSRLERTDAVVVVISPMTRTSPSVDGEIESAQKMGKRIVGVYAAGGTALHLPESFEKYGDALVGWYAEQLLKAIAGELTGWFKPDGVTPFEEREIDHFSCGGEKEQAA